MFGSYIKSLLFNSLIPYFIFNISVYSLILIFLYSLFLIIMCFNIGILPHINCVSILNEGSHKFFFSSKLYSSLLSLSSLFSLLSTLLSFINLLKYSNILKFSFSFLFISLLISVSSSH